MTRHLRAKSTRATLRGGAVGRLVQNLFKRCFAGGVGSTALLALAVSCGGGGGGSPAPPQAWVATQLTGGCVRGPGSLPRSSCQLLRIDGPGVPPLQVELRVIEPDPGVALRGTVLFGTGGYGDYFYGDQSGGEELFAELTALGFRLVDRAWNSSWWSSSATFPVQSHRYATLLSWVHTNIHTGGAFCVTGNSAGAGEIGYALTTWGRAGLVDAAVLSGGPPMTRLGWVCQSPATATWLQRCQALWPPGVRTCGAATCSLSPSSEGVEVCSVPVPNRTLQALRDDSILHPGAAMDFGATRIHVVIGTNDCTNAAVSGLLFFEEVTSEKVLEFAPSTPHVVCSTQAGRDAIVRGLLGTVPGWSGPAALTAAGWPRAGHGLELRIHGRPGEAFQVFASLGTAEPQPSPIGSWLLEPPAVLLGGGFLGATDGRTTICMPLPADAALEGLTLYYQALTGSRPTNALRVVIRP